MALDAAGDDLALKANIRAGLDETR
jgi:hypothetical protein